MKGYNPAPSNNWRFPLTFPKVQNNPLWQNVPCVVGLVCGRVRVGVWLWVSVSVCCRGGRSGRSGRLAEFAEVEVLPLIVFLQLY